jgi:hypothetical protein
MRYEMFCVSESDIGTGAWYANMTDKRKEISCYEELNGPLEASPLARKCSRDLDFSHPGSRGQKHTGSRICNNFNFSTLTGNFRRQNLDLNPDPPDLGSIKIYPQHQNVSSHAKTYFSILLGDCLEQHDFSVPKGLGQRHTVHHRLSNRLIRNILYNMNRSSRCNVHIYE